ncbi:MAG: AzlC family ABC transporter permease [Gammaproteobacteria bacterium]|nr:AzlC family ABC transporter permease [Gammaproteobacteria bacterium]
MAASPKACATACRSFWWWPPSGCCSGPLAPTSGWICCRSWASPMLVIAGASQFATLQLLVDQAPVAVAVLTGLAVNLRMAMYSASLMPHFVGASLRLRAAAAYLMVDQVYAMSVQRYAGGDLTLDERLAYYFGVAAPVIPVWYLGTAVGALVGGRIPPEFALDFAGADHLHRHGRTHAANDAFGDRQPWSRWPCRSRPWACRSTWGWSSADWPGPSPAPSPRRSGRDPHEPALRPRCSGASSPCSPSAPSRSASRSSPSPGTGPCPSGSCACCATCR